MIIRSMVCCCLLISLLASGQQEIEGVKGKYAWEEIEKGYQDYRTGEIMSSQALKKDNDSYFLEVELPWECVGPNVQPMEKNPGGKAIPAYSVGRGNGTGRINFLLVNPDEEDNVFACSPTGGMFVTWDGGKTWENAGTDKLPISGVSSVSINEFDPHNWVISTGDGDEQFMFSNGVWRTFIAGESWENINGAKSAMTIPVSEENNDWTFICQVKAHPCDFNRIFAATNKGLFMSGNAMEEDPEKVEWTKIADGFFYDIEIVPWAESLVFAAGDRLYWSRNCGNEWEQLPLPQWESRSKYKFLRLQIELTSQDPENLYVAVTNSERHRMSAEGEASFQKYNYRSKKWTEIRSLQSKMNNVIPTRARAFTVHPHDSSLVLAGNVQPIYRSTDGGRNFDKIERGQMHDDIHHIVFSPDSGRVWAGHDGGVSISYDGGLTWEARDNGIGVANVFGISVAQTNEDQVLYGAYDTGGNLLKDGDWWHVTWGDGFQTIIDHADPDVMIASKQNGHLNRTMDGGENWDKSVSCGLVKTEWHTWIRMNPLYSNIIYCSGTKLVRSTSQGEDWEQILDPKDLGGDTLNTVYRFYLSDADPNVLYAYALAGDNATPVIFRTFNVNEERPERIKWEMLRVPRKGWLAGLAIDPDDPEKFWMSYLTYKPEGKIYRYTGSRWADIGKGLGYAVAEDLIVERNSNERLYLATNYGIFTRNKLEDKWVLIKGLPGTYIKSLAINYKTSNIFAGTYGRGVWKSPVYRPPVILGGDD